MLYLLYLFFLVQSWEVIQKPTPSPSDKQLKQYVQLLNVKGQYN
jgi:hypothetical protein